MLDFDKWSEIYNSLKKHKLRTFLTALGVFWGIFMLVLLLGAGKGFENSIMRNFDIQKNSLFVWSSRTSVPYKGMKPGRSVKLKNDDIKAIRAMIPEADVIAPRNQLDGNFIVKYKNNNASFSVYGDYPEFIKIKDINLQQGRFINNDDMRESRKIAVIGSRVQEVLFKDSEEDPIGKYIEIKGVYFMIVGLFKPRGEGNDNMEDAQTIYVPNSTFQRAFNKVNQVDWFAFTPKEGVPAAVLEQKVKELLAARHLVAPNDLKAFGSANVEEEYEKVQGLFTGISVFTWVVSIFTIIAGVVGVSNIMFIIVKERTNEIGIRKALGATPLSIISLIVQEALVLTAFAGYAGLVAGVGVIELINFLMQKFNIELNFFYNPRVDFGTAVSALVLLVVTGTLAGLMPAVKAAKVNPVEALKAE